MAATTVAQSADPIAQPRQPGGADVAQAGGICKTPTSALLVRRCSHATGNRRLGSSGDGARARNCQEHRRRQYAFNAGGVRKLHRHPNVDEWQYCMEGQAGMGIFAASGQARSFHFRAGDVGYLPLAMGPYIDNTSATPLRFLDPSW